MHGLPLPSSPPQDNAASGGIGGGGGGGGRARAPFTPFPPALFVHMPRVRDIDGPVPHITPRQALCCLDRATHLFKYTVTFPHVYWFWKEVAGPSQPLASSDLNSCIHA